MTIIRKTDIDDAGGLSFAIDLAFKKIGSALRVEKDDPKFFPGAFARILNDNKFSQVYVAEGKTIYLPDFWRNGVCLAHGATENIELLAECINFWLTNNIRTNQLAEKFPFVKPKKDAVIFDDGKEVAYKWQSILNDQYSKEIKSFVELAIKDPILSRLFPYTSLMTLCFSRCTGYPFTHDTPTVTPIYQTDKYLVRTCDTKEIGSGSASEALQMVLDNLPGDIKPAVKGTSEDL